MTNTITIRLRRPKSEVQARAKPNINAWLNNLIDQALGPVRVDWNEHFDKLGKGSVKDYVSDEVRRASR
jgi:hypothetical protein